jgi:hypothetical protein
MQGCNQGQSAALFLISSHNKEQKKLAHRRTANLQRPLPRVIEDHFVKSPKFPEPPHTKRNDGCNVSHRPTPFATIQHVCSTFWNQRRRMDLIASHCQPRARGNAHGRSPKRTGPDMPSCSCETKHKVQHKRVVRIHRGNGTTAATVGSEQARTDHAALRPPHMCTASPTWCPRSADH